MGRIYRSSQQNWSGLGCYGRLTLHYTWSCSNFHPMLLRSRLPETLLPKRKQAQLLSHGYGRYQKANSRTDRTISENTELNQKTKIGKLKAEIKKRTQETQNWADNIRKHDEPDQKTGRSKIRKQTNKRQKEPLQWRDGLARVRIPMLWETTLLYRSAALHCSICGQDGGVKGARPSFTFWFVAKTKG